MMNLVLKMMNFVSNSPRTQTQGQTPVSIAIFSNFSAIFHTSPAIFSTFSAIFSTFSAICNRESEALDNFCIFNSKIRAKSEQNSSKIQAKSKQNPSKIRAKFEQLMPHFPLEFTHWLTPSVGARRAEEVYITIIEANNDCRDRSIMFNTESSILNTESELD